MPAMDRTKACCEMVAFISLAETFASDSEVATIFAPAGRSTAW
jgi:hypothetical protein